MKFRYKKAVALILGLQTVLLWCYILLRPEDPSLKKPDFDSNMLGSVRIKVPKTKINKPEPMTQETREKVEPANGHVTNGDCIGMVFPVHLLQEESWSAVDDARRVFVFSAYVVEQTGTVKVVGASVRSITKVFCQYWHVMKESHNIKLLVKQAVVHLLAEDHGNKYSGALFDCPASATHASYVSLVTKECNVPLNLLKIKNVIKRNNYQRKFTVCLKPLHFRYGRAYELVEWIEFNILLGAEKIIAYNYSIAINTAQVLEHYVKQGLVEIVQWNLPMKSYTWPKTRDPVEIHSIGMLPMLQDCRLRNKAHSEFVVNLDVDELIIPRSYNVVTWSEMLKQVPSDADTYLFRNTFFRKEWNSSHIDFPRKELVRNLRITSLQTFEREDKIWSAGSRSKYITRTSKDNNLMIHEVQGSKRYVVPVEIGLVHHYRNWENYKDTAKRVVDDTVLRKYGEKLIDKIQSAWKKLKNVTPDIPI